MHHIYLMTNNITGRRYVGQTFGRPIRWRFKDHMKMCRIHKSTNKVMQADYDAYGIDSFTIEEITTCPEAVSHDLEYALMDVLETKKSCIRLQLHGHSQMQRRIKPSKFCRFRYKHRGSHMKKPPEIKVNLILTEGYEKRYTAAILAANKRRETWEKSTPSK